MKKKILLFAVISLSILVGLGVLLFRPVKIGILISNETTLGYEENLMARYFQSRNPRIGLHPIKLLIENPSSLDETSFQEAYERLDRAGAHVILSGELSQTALYVVPLAAQSGIATFGVTSSSHLLSGKKDNFYRIVTPTDFLGGYMAEYVNNLGYKRVASVTSIENAAYSSALAGSFEESFPGQYIQIPFQNYEDTQIQLDRFNPDAIFCIMPETHLVQVIKGVREHDENMAIFSSDWGFMQLISVFSGPLLNGITAISRSGEIPEEYKEFINDFEQIYSLESTFASHNTSTVLYMIRDAIEENGLSRSKINQYFSKPRAYDTLLGSFAMDEYGESHQQYNYFYQIMDDELELRQIVENQEYYRLVNE